SDRTTESWTFPAKTTLPAAFWISKLVDPSFCTTPANSGRRAAVVPLTALVSSGLTSSAAPRGTKRTPAAIRHDRQITLPYMRVPPRVVESPAPTDQRAQQRDGEQE